MQKHTSFEEKKGTWYIRGNVYLSINVLSYLLKHKARLLTSRIKLKNIYQMCIHFVTSLGQAYILAKIISIVATGNPDLFLIAFLWTFFIQCKCIAFFVANIVLILFGSSKVFSCCPFCNQLSLLLILYQIRRMFFFNYSKRPSPF